MSLLEVRDLDIFFGSGDRRLQVVSGLSFSVGESEIFGLAGESGCGKSVTALSIMGILPPAASATGRIFFRGSDLLRMEPESMRKLRGSELSMIFQEPMTSLNPVLTIGYQIAEALMTHRGMSRKEALDEAVMLLKTVQIPSPEVRVKEYPHQLSGGMRQRVMIAMAISCNPALLIADEPTTALDVTIQAQILDLIQRLREERKMSILFITHDLAIIAENAATVGIMYAGRLVETADAREIFHNPKHPYTVGLLASIPTARGTRLTPIAGSVPRPGEQAQGCRYEGRCPLAVRECGLDEPLFTEVTKGHFVRCIRPGEMPWNS